MDDWFTVEKIDASTYASSEYKHWEQSHSYLVIGTKRAALIDTGLGVGNIEKIVSELADLPITVITTHVHWDHIGAHKYFQKVYVYEEEKNWLNGKFSIPLSAVKANLLKIPCDFPADFDPEQYTIFQGKPSMLLHDGDIVDLGSRKLQVIHTPGRSPGHICLYEKSTGYLFSGDVIYQGTLDAFYPSTNPIDFMQSVKRIAQLPLNRILPGHYSL